MLVSIPFDLEPFLFFCLLHGLWQSRFCTSASHLPGAVVEHDGGYLWRASNMFLARISANTNERDKLLSDKDFFFCTHLVRLQIFGTTPGSRMQYETPENVVPMSNAITTRLDVPLYAGVCELAIAKSRRCGLPAGLVAALGDQGRRGMREKNTTKSKTLWRCWQWAFIQVQ